MVLRVCVVTEGLIRFWVHANVDQQRKNLERIEEGELTLHTFDVPYESSFVSKRFLAQLARKQFFRRSGLQGGIVMSLTLVAKQILFPFVGSWALWTSEKKKVYINFKAKKYLLELLGGSRGSLFENNHLNHVFLWSLSFHRQLYDFHRQLHYDFWLDSTNNSASTASPLERLLATPLALPHLILSLSSCPHQGHLAGQVEAAELIFRSYNAGALHESPGMHISLYTGETCWWVATCPCGSPSLEYASDVKVVITWTLKRIREVVRVAKMSFSTDLSLHKQNWHIFCVVIAIFTDFNLNFDRKKKKKKNTRAQLVEKERKRDYGKFPLALAHYSTNLTNAFIQKRISFFRFLLILMTECIEMLKF